MKTNIYGYRSQNKGLVDDIFMAAWFFGLKLLGGRQARHIWLDVKLTKDLKKNSGGYAFCYITGEVNKPREFEIELDASMKFGLEEILKWLAHEMVHLKQFVKGELCDYENKKVQWKSKLLSDDMCYEDMPWEKEAYRLETKLYNEFEEWYYES